MLLACDGLLAIPRFGHDFLGWCHDHSPVASMYGFVGKKMQGAMEENRDSLLSVAIWTLESAQWLFFF